MCYSLISRFQGALLGLAWGEKVGSRRTPGCLPRLNRTPDHPLDRDCEQNLPRWSEQPGLSHLPLPESQTDWSAAAGGPARHTASVLIQSQAWSETFPAPAAATSGAELAIALLPVMLFYHDSLARLRHHLSRTVAAWGGDENAQVEVLAVAQVLAAVLRGQFSTAGDRRFHPLKLLDTVMTDLGRESTAANAPLLPLLERVRTTIARQADLATAMAQLQRLRLGTSPTAIAQALYCFLSTPEDFRLVVLRASQATAVPSMVSAIAGAIAGAGSGVAGLPLTARWLDSQSPSGGNQEPAAADLRQLAACLFAVWAGATDPVPLRPAAIAAPGVIRPR